MGIQRKNPAPPSIFNAAGEPEIQLNIKGLKLSASPPRSPKDAAEETDASPEQP